MFDRDSKEKLQAALDEFFKAQSPGGDRGPIDDPSEFEKLTNSLPPGQREFVTEATRFTKLWEYLSTHNTKLPNDVVRAMRELPKLAHEEQIALLQRINQVLMEDENDAGSSSQFRQ